jgi:hypothetical protein
MEKAEVQAKVLDMFRDFYKVKYPDSKILKIDPNDLDLDPGPFYETLVEFFGIEFDDADDDFGGMGGKVSKTIKFITGRLPQAT